MSTTPPVARTKLQLLQSSPGHVYPFSSPEYCYAGSFRGNGHAACPVRTERMSENTLKVPSILASLAGLLLPFVSGCTHHHEEHHEEPHRVVATTPIAQDVTVTQQYVCQIRSQKHIELRALEGGYLEEIPFKEGQHIEAGQCVFKVLPILYKTKYDAEKAEADLAQLKYNNAERLANDNVISKNELALLKAELDKAVAKAEQAKAELNFASVKAPFDGIVDRIRFQQGSLVEDGDVLTTLSDNKTMWVYFNVPEARYLEYKTNLEMHQNELQVELVLANGKKFDHIGKIGAIEADFNNETGNIAFRADFGNPDGLLRNGQTGTVLIKRVLKDAVVIPQRATFEILDKRYVYIVDKDNVAHQREIKISNELDDIFVIKNGVAVSDTIVLEGVRQIRDSDKVEYEHKEPTEVMAQLKNEAE